MDRVIDLPPTALGVVAAAMQQFGHLDTALGGDQVDQGFAQPTLATQGLELGPYQGHIGDAVIGVEQ